MENKKGKFSPNDFQRLIEAQRLGRIGDFYFDTVSGNVTWSDELYRIMGVPISEPMNFESALSFYIESDRKKLAQLAKESIETGDGFEMEAAFIPRGQSLHRYLFLRTHVIEKTGIGGIVQDITERKESELKLQESARFIQSKNKELELVNNDLKTFTTIAAYDFENTLRTLYTNLEFIISRDAKNLSDPGKANLRKAQRAIQKMKLLVDDIVALSKIEAPDSTPSEADLNLVIGMAIAQLQEKITDAGAEIKAEQLPTVNGFPLLLTLLFQHLLDNAIKFRKPGVKPEITIAYHLAKGKNHAQAHQICVIDNGIGFPQEEAEKIFRMFYRLHEKEYKGSGIGLAICKKIAGLHGATIKIESEPGTGATVRCFFPIN